MTGKERFNAAMRGEAVDRPPIMEIEFQLYRELLGEDPIVGNEYEQLCVSRKEYALQKNAEIFVRAADRLEHDVIRDICGYWENAPGHPALLWLPTLKARTDFIRAVKQTAGNQFSILATVCCPFSIPTGQEMYDFSIDLYENPEQIEQAFHKKTQDALAIGDALLEAGADGLINTADVAFNSGTFMSTEHMERLFFPELDRWGKHVHRQNAHAIWHTDGNITKVLPLAKQCALDGIQCIDPVANMSLGDAMQMLSPDISVIGNVNCSVLQLGTEEEIRGECKRVFQAGRGNNRWIFGCCNAVFKGIPIENYLILMDEYRRQIK